MRIVGGTHKGRALVAPSGREIRPTSDRVRETIFNILVHSIDNFDLGKVSVVDVFAGTGALGLEALSRGAKHATFIDTSRRALDIVKKNSTALNEWRNKRLSRRLLFKVLLEARSPEHKQPLAFFEFQRAHDIG